MAEISTTLAPARLETRKAGFELHLRRFRGVGVELSLASVGGGIDLKAPPLRDCYVIVIPVSGSFTAGTRDQSCVVNRDSGIVMSPDQSVYFNDLTDDCRQLCVRIDKSKVTSAIGQMLGRPIADSTRFDLRLDVSAPISRPLMQALEMAATEVLEDPVSPARTVLAATISTLVVDTLALSQNHSYTDELRLPPTDPEYPEHVRTAQRYILEHAGEAIGVADIAGAVNLSVRALEEGFARHLHVPPTAYLREVRLVRAHDELSRSTAEQSSVREIAERWGFRHAGRFSSLYRAQFGVSPSQHLKNRDTTRLRSPLQR
ncbi:AraC family transcriptional regulator [Rhodococcus qingshengii]|uniref:AraC family transcriptional regulator n=1 Tax=Rhodococcus qingshengii TaxID=334542 RepID=UPI001FD03885|nr:AraC family transcriptional regulator [Rhodococcus qingshengii]